MKKLLSILTSLLLVMSLFSTAVFAADNSVTVDTDKDTMTFTTSLVMADTAVTVPEVTFEYSISTGDIYGTTTVEKYEGATVGTSAFEQTTLAPTAAGETQYKEATVDFSGVNFDTTGIYHYTITATASSVEGIVMDDETTREIYVYVVQDETTADYVIDNIVMTTVAISTTAVTDDVLDSTNVKKSSGFVNGYGVDPSEDPNPDPTPEDPNTAYEDFIITSTVDGNMADRNKDFTVTLTTGADIPVGTIFEVTDATGATVYVKYVTAEAEGYPNTFVFVTYDDANGWVEGDAAVFTIKSGQTITIHSVVNGMSFTTVMTGEDNYTIYSEMNGATESDEEVLLTNTVVIDADEEQSIESNNYYPTYDLTIPDTGVLVDFLPFIALVVLAGGLMVVRSTKLSSKKAK